MNYKQLFSHCCSEAANSNIKAVASLSIIHHPSSTGESPRVPRTQDNEEVIEGISPQEPEITERSQSTSSDGDNAADEDETEDPLLSRVQDLNAFFKMGPGGFSRNPEKLAFVHLQKYLSNIKWVSQNCTHIVYSHLYK